MRFVDMVHGCATCFRLHAPRRMLYSLGGTQAMLSIRYVHAIVGGVEGAGVPRAHFLRAADFGPERLELAEGRVSYAEFSDLCELALDLTEDPALGLHAIELACAMQFNVVAHMVSHAPSLRHAIDTRIELHRLTDDDCVLQLNEDADSATVLCRQLGNVPSRVRRLFAELHMAGEYRLLRLFARDARPHEARFGYAAPPYRAEYARFFDGTERFDQPVTALVFDRTLLDAPSPYKDEELFAALCAQARNRIARLVESAGYAQRVRDFLLQRGTPGRIDMGTVAHALGLSTRSLRRRLSSEGVSYDAVANDALASRAKHLLAVEQRTIQETAHAMGYSDTSAFHRAFKRWTGTTPSACRAQR